MIFIVGMFLFVCNLQLVRSFGRREPNPVLQHLEYHLEPFAIGKNIEQ